MAIKELVEMIKDAIRFGGAIRWDTSRPDGQPRRVLNTSRALREFGSKARTPFQEGLARTVAWYEERLGDRTLTAS